MVDEVRYGIIGTGMMGNEHIANINLLDGARVTAIADPNEECRATARATAGGAVPMFADHRDLLDRDDVDVVVVASPNFTHRAVLDDVFQTGKHILIEKPLCTTIEDCLHVEAAAAKHPGLVWVAMEYRYMPPVARFIDAVRDGAVGRLVMLAIREHRYPFLPKIGDWNRFARNTGGTLVEKCCHFFDLMNLIIESEPVRVLASGGQDVNHLDEEYDGEVPDILDNAYAIVEYAGGERALLDLCMFAECSPNEQEMAATGDGGKVECFVPESVLRFGKRWSRDIEEVHVPVDARALEAGGHVGGTYYQHEAFLAAVRDGTPPVVSVRDGLMAVALGHAAERSIQERRPIELAELGI